MQIVIWKCFALEEEIELIRRQCSEEVYRKCHHLQEELHKVNLDHAEEIKLHKQALEDKVDFRLSLIYLLTPSFFIITITIIAIIIMMMCCSSSSFAITFGYYLDNDNE